ncbi:MAG: hypothetical protein QF357_12260, partial [Dehalococcoidia bacterium]|nr:hypothetical protein [Dehalococcoidia bacterium]
YDPAAYRSSCFASDVVAVLDDAGIDRAHFFGHSMGAFIGYSVAKHAPFRLLSLALGGADPYEPDPSTVDSLKTSLEHGLAVAIAEVEAQHGPVPPRMKATALANNLHALRAALQSPREDYLPGLRIFTGSCLLYAGFMDPAYSGIQKLAEEMPGATFLSLPRLDHWSSFVSTSDILPYIRAFLRTVK